MASAREAWRGPGASAFGAAGFVGVVEGVSHVDEPFVEVDGADPAFGVGAIVGEPFVELVPVETVPLLTETKVPGFPVCDVTDFQISSTDTAPALGTIIENVKPVVRQIAPTVFSIVCARLRTLSLLCIFMAYSCPPHPPNRNDRKACPIRLGRFVPSARKQQDRADSSKVPYPFRQTNPKNMEIKWKIIQQKNV